MWKILENFNMLEWKSASTPCEKNLKLSKYEEDNEEDGTLFWSIVESLIYLTLTRPDISYGVGIISQYITNPKHKHMVAVERTLRYLKHTYNYGLFYDNKFEAKLIGYCNSDWEINIDDRRSISGYVFMFRNSAILW